MFYPQRGPRDFAVTFSTVFSVTLCTLDKDREFFIFSRDLLYYVLSCLSPREGRPNLSVVYPQHAVNVQEVFPQSP